jgi:hypothetical protein
VEHNKASDLDGFPVEIFQTFQDIIKGDLLELFGELHDGQLKLFPINFGEIILLPKINDAERTQKFSPVCLLNVYFH